MGVRLLFDSTDHALPLHVAPLNPLCYSLHVIIPLGLEVEAFCFDKLKGDFYVKPK